jgi:hypothetical protein
MKTKDKNMNVQNVSSNGTLKNKKQKKTITPIWCKIIPKIDVEQIKNNMREIIFIYTLLGTYFKKSFQANSKCLKMSQINSRYLKIFLKTCLGAFLIAL